MVENSPDVLVEKPGSASGPCVEKNIVQDIYLKMDHSNR
jgi:hypothetical protein